MARLALIAALFASTALSLPQLTPDPAGIPNVGNAAGTQFIGAECLSSLDCASACCAFNADVGGICSGPGAQFQAGKRGCGFGDGGAPPPPPPPPTGNDNDNDNNQGGGNQGGNQGGNNIDANLPGSENAGTGNGRQFITGQCLSDADCQSGCCNGPLGRCAARAVATENGRDGCGFVG